MKEFTAKDLGSLYKPKSLEKGANGTVAVIGGSSLFHGAPLFSLVAASRVVDMVFFASPEKTLEKVAAELKSRLGAFIWVPWEEVEEYIQKADATLIGPGFMRYRSEKSPENQGKTFHLTKTVSESLLSRFPTKKWVIDAGTLQTMETKFIPKDSVLTPNRKEFEKLFGPIVDEEFEEQVKKAAKDYGCVVAGKGANKMIVSDGTESYIVPGGKVPLTMGGTGDVLAGLVVALLAKNQPLLATSAAGYLVQSAVNRLADQVGTNFNADDLAWEIGKAWKEAGV